MIIKVVNEALIISSSVSEADLKSLKGSVVKLDGNLWNVQGIHEKGRLSDRTGCIFNPLPDVIT